MKRIFSFFLTICMVATLSAPLTAEAATKYTYSQTKALEYAAKHWNDGVGLCAEFVWRCVQAGGIKISKKTGTRSCFNGIVKNSHATKHQLKLNSKGMATKADNAAILAPGDVVVQYCTYCDLFPHIVLFSKYDSNGNALYYAHNGAMNNKKYQLNQNSQHKKKKCNIIAYVAHFPQNTSAETVKVETVPTISLSQSTLNLDISSNPTATIQVALSGTLSSKYYMNFECNTKLDFAWGGWTNNETKNSIRITATQETQSGAIGTVSIVDNNTGKVQASKSFTINVTKPAPATQTETTAAQIILSKSALNLDLASNPSDTIDITVTGNLPAQYRISRSSTSELLFDWGEWSDNKLRVKVTATQNTKDGTTCMLLLLDGSGNVCANTKFTVNVSKTENRKASLSKTVLNLDYANHRSETITVTMPDTTGLSGADVVLAPEFEHKWSNPTDTTLDLTITAVKNVDRESEASVRLKDLNGNVVSETYFQVNLVGSGVEIVYDANGGKNAPEIENLPVGSTLYVTSAEPTRAGYVFKGWSRSQSDKYPQFTAGDAMHVADTGFTLYAVWAEDTASAAEKFSDRNMNGISVYVSGKKVEFDVQPQLINSRTMVPLRAIFEALGADVEWDAATQTAIGEMVGDVVEITIGKNFLQKNHEKKSLDSPAVIISGRTLVPVRAIAECFDCEVKWHADLRVVEIIK